MGQRSSIIPTYASRSVTGHLMTVQNYNEKPRIREKKLIIDDEIHDLDFTTGKLKETEFTK